MSHKLVDAFLKAGWDWDGHDLARAEGTTVVKIRFQRGRLELVDAGGNPDVVVGWLHGALALHRAVFTAGG